MPECCIPRKTPCIKAQKTPSKKLLGACLSIGAEDLSFVDPEIEWLAISKKQTGDSLIITITGAKS